MLEKPLSKTALQQGAQCPRMLWIKHNMPYATDKIIASDQNIADEADSVETEEQFVIGDIVGEAALKYFPQESSVLIDTSKMGFSPEAYIEYAQQTKDYMNDPNITCIAEAAFYDGDLIVFVDFLNRNEYGSWDIYECKSSRHVGPIHAQDAAWQTWVVMYNKPNPTSIGKTYLIHPMYGWYNFSIETDDAKISDLFEVVDDYSDWIREQVESGEIGRRIEELIEVVKAETPPKCVMCPGKDDRCFSPYQCNYIMKCTELFENNL